MQLIALTHHKGVEKENMRQQNKKSMTDYKISQRLYAEQSTVEVSESLPSRVPSSPPSAPYALPAARTFPELGDFW